MKKYKVGVLGATGMVGQNYVRLLENHPWFEVSWVAASQKSAGKTYEDAVLGRWHMNTALPKKLEGLTVNPVDDLKNCLNNCDFVFSALDSDTAKEFEEKYAKAGIPVISNASTHRKTPDVPMIIPEINPEHLDIIPIQRKNRNWDKGFIVVKPNCSLQSYLTPLYALHKEFQVQKVVVTTLQAVSGAGHPGVSSLDIVDNAIPFIGGEEEKTENEPLKIFGKISGNKIVDYEGFTISAHCNRVPVIDGHMACVSVKFLKKPLKEKILETWENFEGVPQKLNLPFAPKKPIIYLKEQDRPQPRLDRDLENGMAVSVGRLRECNVLDFRFVGLSHNTVRGAAGGGVLNAELVASKKLF